MTAKLKTIKIIHMAICAGVIIAYILIGNITSMDNIKLPNLNISSSIYILIPFLAIYMSHFMYQSQIKNVDVTLKIEEKIPFYQTATIIRLAILEGAAFFILVIKPDFICLGFFVIMYMIFIRPSENQFKKDFKIF